LRAEAAEAEAIEATKMNDKAEAAKGAMAAMAAATALREKEAAAYAKVSSEDSANLNAIEKAVRFAGKKHEVQYVQSSLTMRSPVAIQNEEMFLQFGQSSCESGSLYPQYMQGVMASGVDFSLSGTGLRTMFSIFFLYCSETCGRYSGFISVQAY